MKYKFVILRGPDLSQTKFLENYSESILIGDGKNYINKTDLDILKDKIDSRTIFYIEAHGGEIAISLIEGEDLIGVLRIINELANNNPIEAHLFSCCSSDSVSLVENLPLGSVLISHSINKEEQVDGCTSRNISNHLSFREKLNNKYTTDLMYQG